MTIFRPDKSEKRAFGDSLADLIALSGRGGRRPVYSGVIVNDDTALTNAAVWGCVDLLADLVSTLPVDEYKRGGSQELVAVPKSVLLDDPAGDGYGFEVWCRGLMVSLLLRGNYYGWVTALGPDGWPSQIESLHPDEVQPRRYHTSGPVGWYRDGKQVERWPAGPLWHVPAFTFPGNPVGMSPIRYAAETIGVGIAAHKFGAQWFGDGTHPTALLESDQQINQDQAEILKQRVRDAKNSRDTLVLGLGTHMKPVQVSPEESQFLQTIKANADDVARFFFRRPPGEGGNVTYANVEARSLDLLTYTLNGWMVRVEKALTRIRPRPRFVKFNADALIRVDIKTRYDVYQIAIRNRLKSPDECRALENEPPIPDGSGDNFYGPMAPGKEEPQNPATSGTAAPAASPATPPTPAKS